MIFARIPIRPRLALAFAVVMSLVIGAMGLFVHARLSRELNAAITTSLRSRADVVVALVRQADTGLRENRSSALAARGESFAQVLDRTGRVVDTTPQLGSHPLLSVQELRLASRRTTLIDAGPVAGNEGRSRLLATPVLAQGKHLVIVVGTSLEARDKALQGLTTQLLIGGSAALVLASLAGYGLALAVLRPVESMRTRAAAITARDPGVRLPVSPADDEIQRLGHTLNAMLGRLEDAHERQRSFVADASHELRTPLALLKGELELALGSASDPDGLTNALRTAIEETDRMSQLAEDLLVLASADEGLLQLRQEIVPAEDILEHVAQRFALRAHQSKREITIEHGENPPVIGDPHRLEQAVANLVDNALRHGTGTIRLQTSVHKQTVRLHVLDSGPGVPAGFASRAFDRFSRADDARSRGGTGLGLAIVAVIANAHGGDAQIANRPDGVTDAWISLPANKRAPPPPLLSTTRENIGGRHG